MNKLSPIDWAIMVLGAIAALGYGVYLQRMSTEYFISWPGYVYFVIFGALTIGLGYYSVRQSESKPGEWSLGEVLGTLCVAIGLMIVSEGMFDGFVARIFELVPRPMSNLPNPQPPVVHATKAKTSDELKIERIGEKGGKTFIKSGQTVQVKVVLVLDAEKTGDTYTVDPVKVPPGSHGKVWYEVDGQKSLADEF